MHEPNPLAAVIRRWEQRSELPAEDRKTVLALPFVPRTLQRDSYLVREGENTNACALLVSGFAYRQKLVADGARQIISFHVPGEFVDLQNLLLHESDHNVQALTRVEVAFVTKSALLEAMATSPAIQKAVWLDTLIDASIFREWVVNVGRRDARTKIAHLLCEFVVRARTAGVAEGMTCSFPLTQEHIADATGLTSVHTNRTLQRLRRDGLIELAAGSLTVRDWDTLAGAGDFDELYLHHEA